MNETLLRLYVHGQVGATRLGRIVLGRCRRFARSQCGGAAEYAVVVGVAVIVGIVIIKNFWGSYGDEGGDGAKGIGKVFRTIVDTMTGWFNAHKDDVNK
jgi:hypothetical protein